MRAETEVHARIPGMLYAVFAAEELLLRTIAERTCTTASSVRATEETSAAPALRCCELGLLVSRQDRVERGLSFPVGRRDLRRQRADGCGGTIDASGVVLLDRVTQCSARGLKVRH